MTKLNFFNFGPSQFQEKEGFCDHRLVKLAIKNAGVIGSESRADSG